MALTKEEKQLLKIYNKTEDEKIKEVLGKLLDEDDEVQEEEEVEEETQVEQVEVKEPETEEEPEQEEKFDFKSEFENLTKQFKIVVDEVKTLKEQKVKEVGLKAKPKEPSNKFDFDAVFQELQAKQKSN